jgi:hypothetical protein
MIRAALLADWPSSDWPEQRVLVEVADDQLALSLGESPAVRRELPADADCAVRAKSVAVVIAAWSGELASRPTASPVLAVSRPAPVLAPLPRSSHVTEVNVAPFYSLFWGHALGAWLDVARTRRDGGLGVRALAAYQSAREVALEGGTNQVLRFLVGATLTYQLQGRRLFTSGDVGVIGSFTRARGSGYEKNGADAATNVGGLADLRGGLRLGRFLLSLHTRLVRLVSAENVKIQSTSPGVNDSSVLSAWDLQVGAGLGFRFE